MLDPDRPFGPREVLVCEDVELLGLDLQCGTLAVGCAGQDNLATQVGQVSQLQGFGFLSPNHQGWTSGLEANKNGLQQFNRITLRAMLHALRGDLPSCLFGQTETNQIKPFDKPVRAFWVTGLRDWAILAGSLLG
jgi:hypothetical protein